jgi:hypothetical protein
MILQKRKKLASLKPVGGGRGGLRTRFPGPPPELIVAGA